MNLAAEIAVSATGCDCPATAAFVNQVLKAHPLYAAVSAHWDAADEPLKEALASHLGWAEPTTERCPVNKGILNAYEAVLTAGYEAIGEPD